MQCFAFSSNDLREVFRSSKCVRDVFIQLIKWSGTKNGKEEHREATDCKKGHIGLQREEKGAEGRKTRARLK